MLASTPLRLSLALLALVTAGSAHAGSVRSAQSLPAAKRAFTPPPATAQTQRRMPERADRRDENRFSPDRRRSGGREDYGNRGRGENEGRGRGDRDGPRSYDRDRHDFDEAKDRESHHMGHHGHDDSPGC